MANLNFLKKLPIALILRTLALSIILTLAAVNIQLIPGIMNKVKLGFVNDFRMVFDSNNGEYFVLNPSPEALRLGVHEGDILINPELYYAMQTIDKPVTFFIKTKNVDEDIREATFLPKPMLPDDYIGSLLVGLSPTVGLQLETKLFLGIDILVVLLSLIAFGMKLDGLIAFLFMILFSQLFSVWLGVKWIIFNLIFPSAIILFLLLFPNGKLAPRWSWIFIFLPLFKIIINNDVFIAGLRRVAQVQDYPSINSAEKLIPIIALIIIGSIGYWYRASFTSIERRRLLWLFLFLVLIQILPDWFIKGFYYSEQYILMATKVRSFLFIRPPLYNYPNTEPIYAILAIWIYRYKYVFTSIEKQQMKWLIIGLILSVTSFISFHMFFFYQDFFLPFLIDMFLVLEFSIVISSFLLALLHFRLHDVDIIINHTLVYCGSILAASSVWFFYDTLREVQGPEKNFLTLQIAVLLIVVTFRPIYIILQKQVNKLIPPEKFSFSETFFELTPEMNIYFSQSELYNILITKATEYFEVKYASVFIKNRNGNLKQIKTTLTEKNNSKAILESHLITELEKNKLVAPNSNSNFSAVVPLTLPRGKKDELIGALLLGPRLNQLGYSSEMKKILKKLGEEAGKSLYMAQIKVRNK